MRPTLSQPKEFETSWVDSDEDGKADTDRYGNEIITLVKDTSLASVIAIPEILMNAKDFSMQGLIWPLFYSAVFFLAFCGVLTLLFSYIEKKLDYYKG